MPEPRPSTTPRGSAVRSLVVVAVLLALVVGVHLALGTSAALAVAGLVAVVVGFVALMGGATTARAVRGRRGAVAVLVVGGAGAFLGGTAFADPGAPAPVPLAASPAPSAPTALRIALDALPVHEAAADSGFDAARRFGRPWADADGAGCDARVEVLRRDLTRARGEGCRIAGGVLHDPWSGEVVRAARHGVATGDVRIGRYVSLRDAWRTGAAALPKATRVAFANDPANLAAVAAATAADRGAGDAASWLPVAPAARCGYVATQVAVKRAYGLWVTPSERAALDAAVADCGDTVVPAVAAPPAAAAPAEVVRGGASCTAAGATARNRSGAAVVCRDAAADARLRWRLPA